MWQHAVTLVCVGSLISVDSTGLSNQGDTNVESQAYDAARLEFLALRSTIDSQIARKPPTRFFFGSTGPLSREEIVLSLLAANKPARCRTHAIDDTLTVKCESPADSSEASAMLQLGSEDGKAFRQAIEKQFGGPDVLVLGTDEELLVSLEVVERWFTDYHSAIGIRLEPPRNGRAVLRIHRSP